MKEGVDLFVKLTESKKYQILIILIACIVPGLTYIFLFHEYFIFNLDWIKILLISFMFSAPVLLISMFPTISLLSVEKGKRMRILPTIDKNKESFLSLWLTIDVIVFYTVLFTWFIHKQFLNPNINQSFFWVQLILCVIVFTLIYELQLYLKISKKGKKSI